jgi:uncharacterized membrane protein YgaE (UPF0421/DUF939 family)
MTSQLTNPLFMVFKAILACVLALMLDQLLGNPDHVSSTFVALLCLTPTVSMGLLNARAQIISGLLGALFGTGLNLLGWPMELALPLAVGLAIGSSFALRMGAGYSTAAFSALFVVLVHFHSPAQTLGVRVLSLSIAALSSFLVNALVSALIYRDIFTERMGKVEKQLYAVLPAVIAGHGEQADQVFELLAVLKQQMNQTLQELAFRRDWQTHAQVLALRKRAQLLNYLLHLVWDLAWLQAEEGLEGAEVEAFVAWIRGERADFMLLPDALLGIQRRIVSVLKRLHAEQV